LLGENRGNHQTKDAENHQKDEKTRTSFHTFLLSKRKILLREDWIVFPLVITDVT
jgi:hypothetical protein